MKIKLLTIGKTDSRPLQQLIDEYCKRLGFYIHFNMDIIPDIKNTKNLTTKQQKIAEGKELLKKIEKSDAVILLDENGKLYNSIQFSAFLQKKMNSGLKKIVFVIGGPYGFSEDVYNRSNEKISLSPMTFSHQMVRLFFTEQLYRSFTILRNEPYHHH
ncbi:23S rRNA (pseudouridine(1915)-N(3))-methyltransferase RlmH [Flavobacteriaceae bacterium]|nr:23S rRNA (pseudouridine(1915)-N(3))-methyltransferase RlmH [Flavobacteriaceae bacterium]